MEHFCGRQKITFAKIVNIAALVGKQSEPLGQGGEFIQIECKHENAIHEAMRLGRKALVQNLAFVETGIHS